MNIDEEQSTLKDSTQNLGLDYRSDEENKPQSTCKDMNKRYRRNQSLDSNEDHLVSSENKDITKEKLVSDQNKLSPLISSQSNKVQSAHQNSNRLRSKQRASSDQRSDQSSESQTYKSRSNRKSNSNDVISKDKKRRKDHSYHNSTKIRKSSDRTRSSRHGSKRDHHSESSKSPSIIQHSRKLSHSSSRHRKRRRQRRQRYTDGSSSSSLASSSSSSAYSASSSSSFSSSNQNKKRQYTSEELKKKRHHNKSTKDSYDHQASNDIRKPQPKKSKWDVADPEEGSRSNNTQGNNAQDTQARRIFVENLPLGATEASIRQFFDGAILGVSGIDYNISAATGNVPTIKAEYFPEHRYCFLEFRTSAETAIALKLKGITFNGQTLKIDKAADHNMISGFQEMANADALSAQLKRSIPEQKVYVTDLPLTLTDQDLQKLCQGYGTVKSTAIMKDLRTGQSTGCGIVEFENAASAELCVKELNGNLLGDRRPRFAQGPLVTSNVSRIGDCDRASIPQTSPVVTELPTSMTHKIFTNALIGAQIQAARKQGFQSSEVVQLLNCVYPEDLIKDEDCQAIVDDIRKEVSEYGDILDVVIPKPPPDLSFQPGVGKVFIHFADITAARRAQAELNGRRYEQRRVICAAFYPKDRFLSKNYTLI